MTNIPDMPCSHESEAYTLGALLINPDVFVSLAAFLNADDFHLERNAQVWRAMSRLYERGDAIDYGTVCEELSRIGALEMIGGAAYLTKLVNETPTSLHAEMYARLVHRTSTRRKLLQAYDNMRALVLNEELDLDEIIAESDEHYLAARARQDEQDRRGRFMVATMNNMMDELAANVDGELHTISIPTGFTDLDAIKGGIEPQELVVWAGRPGMGKSAIFGNMTLNMGKAGYKVALFPNEMSERAVRRRWIASETGIPVDTLRQSGKLTAAQYSTAVDVAGQLSTLPVYIDDSLHKPSQIEAACRWLRRTNGLDMVLIDGMYRMRGDGKFKDRYHEMSEIVLSLKNIAKRLDIPIMVTHQLSRSVEQRKDKRPMLSDLRDSGRIEEEADAVIFIYRDVVYNSATEWPRQADIIIAKNREGSPGNISLYTDLAISKFANAAARRVNLNEDDARAHEWRMGGKL